MKFSIRYKFAIGFLLIFCVSFNCITIFVNKVVVKNNEKIIYDEFLNSEKDLNLYLNQYIIINKMICDEDNFGEYCERIGSAINSKINERIIIYSKDRKVMFDSDYNSGNFYLSNGTIISDDYSDLDIAISGESAYKVVNFNGVYEAVFSKPLYINNNVVGILRYTKDYTELFENSNNMILNIKLFMLIIFLIVFIFSFILSTRIIIPIIKLNKVTKEIINGNFEFNISSSSNDEIGELTENFNIMRTRIKEQICTIENDRDNLIKSESHRKVFYDNVTHEIKTPLTIIDGYAQMILDQESLDKELIFKAASKIKNESKKLINMIIDILNISKLESKSSYDLKEKIDMKQCIENICSQISIKARKYEISINKILDNDVFVYANLNDINSMIVNILDNSIKYSSVKSEIKIYLFKDEHSCNIIFKDKGKGIDDETIKKIFEPFYRGENTLEHRKKGNGLGLSIVKSIVNKYIGEIKVESEINKETKIFIKLPLFTTQQQLD